MRIDSQHAASVRRCAVLRPIVVLLVLIVLGAASGQPRVVVTLHPYFDLVQRIAGPEAQVVRLLPPGASPHGFDPTPELAANVARADLVVLNGGLDEWVLDLVSSRPPSVLEALDVLEGLEGLAAEPTLGTRPVREQSGGNEGPANASAADDHGHGPVNPHVWLDPVLMEQFTLEVAARLADVDPVRAETYRANGDAVAAQLRSLHDELAVELQGVHGRPFIPLHDAWPYFAARYGLELVIEIEPFPGREPGPRYLADVLGAIRASGARAVFAEAQLGARPVEAIAQEAGVAVAVLDPVGGVEGRMRYEDILRYNARTIARALGAP